MTTNIFLDSIGQNVEIYQGTYSCDNIPLTNKPCKIAGFVVNLSREGQPGSHFVSVVVTPTRVEYFDSFGLKCFNLFILNYMLRYQNNYYYNKVAIQNIQSEYCGLYALACIIEYNHNGNLKSFISMFKNDTVLNDEIVTNYLCRML